MSNTVKVFVSGKQTALAWQTLERALETKEWVLRSSYPEYNRTTVPEWQAFRSANYTPDIFGFSIPAAVERLIRQPDVQRFLCSQRIKVGTRFRDPMTQSERAACRWFGPSSTRLCKPSWLKRAKPR